VHPVAVTGPEIASEAYGDSPALGAVALATGTGELMVFAVNRDVAKPIDVEVQLRGWGNVTRPRARVLEGSKSAEVGLRELALRREENFVSVVIPPASLLAVSFETSAAGYSSS